MNKKALDVLENEMFPVICLHAKPREVFDVLMKSDLNMSIQRMNTKSELPYIHIAKTWLPQRENKDRYTAPLQELLEELYKLDKNIHLKDNMKGYHLFIDGEWQLDDSSS